MNQIHDRLDKRHLIDLLKYTDNLLSYLAPDYVYRAINDAYIRRYHKSADQIVGHHISEILGDEAFLTIIQPNLDQAFTGKTVQYESWFQFPNQPRCYLIVTYNPCFDDHGKVEGVVVSAVDYTLFKTLEEEKQRQDNILIDIAKMAQLGEMISFLSHQWRRPLNLLASYLLKLRTLIGSGDEAVHAIERSETVLEQLSASLESLYAFYSQNPSEARADLRQCIDHAVAIVRDRVHAHGIKIVMNPINGLRVKGQTDQIIHVLLVVIENAVDAILHADISDKIVEISVHPMGGMVIIDIQDNGDGISAEYAQRVFEPGFTTKPTLGLGYGLYFAKKIIEERLQGSIELLPTSKKGAWFRITLLNTDQILA